jgi:predicted nucleic acid-binding protein
VRFWDSSAVVAILVREDASGTARSLLAADSQLAAWWGTIVECTSAIARRERATTLSPVDAANAYAALVELAESWREVPPSARLRETARRIVRTHDLRAADAFQLAAAQEASEGHPQTLELITLDDRLAVAAQREGFPVLP